MNVAALLYVSDCPETFTAHGVLFRAPLPTDGRIARLLLDHVNGTGTPMRLMAGIVNVGAGPGTVSVLGGTGGPDANAMAVGHSASLQFFRSGEQVAITHALAGGAAIPLVDLVLQPAQCVAAIYDIDCGSGGGSYDIRVIACAPENDSLAVFDQLPVAPDDGKSRRGVFDIKGASAPTPITYDGAPAVFRLGAATFTRADLDPYQGPDHRGEYGVLRRFACSLSGSGTVALYQSARAGEATATYWLDGTLLASHGIPAGPRSKIATYELTEGQTRTFALSTMAEINSSYPLELSFDTDNAQLANAGTPDSPVYEA